MKFKVRIKKAPKMDQGGAFLPDYMAYGGQLGYGLDLGYRGAYDTAAEDPYKASNTLQPVPRELANIEAEKGETAYGDIDGDGEMEHMNIGGKRHSQGGTPLSVKEGTFIYSDTKKMQIGGSILEKFGKAGSGNKKYTPANLAKQYDINKYKAIVDDPKSDPVKKKTAMMMVANYEKKLAELALIQEGMKGFPQGIPAVAESYVAEKQMAAQGEQQPVMKYGGSLEKYQKKGEVKYGRYADDYTALKDLLTNPDNKALRDELYNRYKQAYPNTPATQDEYISDLLAAQQQIYAINERYADDPSKLTDRSWDTGGKNKRYNQEAKALGYTPLNDTQLKRFQQGYRILADLIEDPRFKDQFGDVFQLNPKGVSDQQYKGKPISGDDTWMGNTSIGQFFTLRNKKQEETSEKNDPAPKYVCKVDAQGNVTAVTSLTGYNSPEEALANCPGKEFKPKEQGMFLPDKLKIANSLVDMTTNKKFYPWEAPVVMPDASFVGYDPTRELAADAENRNMLYAANAMFGSPQQMAARNSAVSGSAAQNAANILARYNNLNVGQAQKAMDMQTELDMKEALLNSERSKRLYDGTTRVNQEALNFERSARNKLLTDFASGWENMMNFNIADSVNPQYAVDRNNAQVLFKYAKNPWINNPGSTTPAGVGASNNYFDQLEAAVSSIKNKFPNLTDKEAIDVATKGFSSGFPNRTTYRDKGNDGYIDDVTQTVFGK